MKGPRIAMLSEHANPLALLGGEDSGGQNVYVGEVSANAAALGFTVDVFTRQDSENVPQINEWRNGVRVINIRAGPAIELKKDQMWPYMPEFRDNILNFVREQNTEYDLIHGNFWMSGWVGAALKNEWRVPFVQIFHALGKVKRLHQGEADTSPDERVLIEYEVMDAADAIIAQCPAEKEELQQLYGVDERKIHIVPSAVDADLFKPVPKRLARRALGLDIDSKILLYVGRLLPRKGIDTIVRALAVLAERLTSPPRLLIVGGDADCVTPQNHDEARRLSQIAADLGVDHLIVFIGRRRHNILRYYYSAADICVSVPWYEPFGLVPLEAMACGTPIVVAKVGGMQFTVQDGRTGFHVPPKDPQALASKLLLLLSDDALRKTMGKLAREHVRRFFTWQQVARRTAAIYYRLLSDRASGNFTLQNLRDELLT